MLSRLQTWTRYSTANVLVAGLLTILTPLAVSAQEQPSFLSDTFKRVILDPTTYAPSRTSGGAIPIPAGISRTRRFANSSTCTRMRACGVVAQRS